jgi:hypothetical protein
MVAMVTATNLLHMLVRVGRRHSRSQQCARQQEAEGAQNPSHPDANLRHLELPS